MTRKDFIKTATAGFLGLLTGRLLFGKKKTKVIKGRGGTLIIDGKEIPIEKCEFGVSADKVLAIPPILEVDYIYTVNKK